MKKDATEAIERTDRDSSISKGYLRIWHMMRNTEKTRKG